MGWRSIGCIAACGVACCAGLGVVRAYVQLGCRAQGRIGACESSGDSWAVRGRSESGARVGVLGVGGVAVGMGGRWLRVVGSCGGWSGVGVEVWLGGQVACGGEGGGVC